MQQFCTYGSVRGAVSNGRPYRDKKLRHRKSLNSRVAQAIRLRSKDVQ